jgi:quercetin dioxygenase-like cupin family protein
MDVNVVNQMLGNGLLTLSGMSVDWDTRPLEGGTDPNYGTVRWRTIFDADQTAGTTSMVVGVAEFGPSDVLLPHRHSAAEVYLGLEGEGTVTIEGVGYRMAPGIALFVPEDAEHSTVAGPGGLRFLYVFAKDRFSDVHYVFSPSPQTQDETPQHHVG